MDKKLPLHDLRIRLSRYSKNVAIKKEYELRLQEEKEKVGLKAVAYDNMPGGSGVGKTTETQAINLATVEEKYNNFIKNKEVEISRIENALSVLTPKQKEIIMLKHIDNNNWNTVAYKTNRSIRTCKNIEIEALNNMYEIISI